jgi:hypothetical protein
MRRLGRIVAGAAIAWCCGITGAAAGQPSVPAPHPDFQAMHVLFGRWTCTFHFSDGKSMTISGSTELSSDGRRAIRHDAYGQYFQNLWYDAARRLWLETSIITPYGIDFTATSPGWSGGEAVFTGLVTLRGQSLSLRTSTTLLSQRQNKTVEDVQDAKGEWCMLDTTVCSGV